MGIASTPDQDSQPHAEPRRVDQLLEHYGQSHQHPTNEQIHYLAIPVIMFSLTGLIASIHPGLAYIFIAASMVYYARLSGVFFVSMAAISMVMLVGLHALDARGVLFKTSAALFVGAWIFQFIGHKIEGKKPSFFEDIQYLWVGPLFVLSKLFRAIGIRW
jgi:uncharacterized membrane protein YGL010W